VNKKLMRRDKPQTIPASQLFTGAPVFSGAASFTGTPVFSGPASFTGTATFSGGLITGSASTNTLNGTTTVGASAVLNLTANYQSALRFGTFYLWVNSGGTVRISGTAPTADTGGTAVGAQT
jgi:hypothetical protein